MNDDDMIVTCDGVGSKDPLYGVTMNQRFSKHEEAMELKSKIHQNFELHRLILEEMKVPMNHHHVLNCRWCDLMNTLIERSKLYASPQKEVQE